MRLPTRLLGLAAAAAAVVAGAPAATAAPPGAAAAVDAVTVFETGGVTAGALAVAADGRVFYGGPGDGGLRVWTPGTGASTLFASVPRGTKITGVTLHPRFPATPWVYVAAAVRSATGERTRLFRFTDQGGTGGATRMLRDIAPVGTDHLGGKLTFTPDGRFLELVVGDGGDPANAQDRTSLNGKLLRLTPTGANAPGNPFGTAVWAYGIRNSIGLAHDPVTGRLWETENGPDCGEEINLLRAGGNYAWGPRATCEPLRAASTNRDGGAGRVLPVRWYAQRFAPTGIVFCDGCGLPGSEDALLYARYLTGQVQRVVLNAARTGIARESTLYTADQRVLALERHPGTGEIWFSDATRVRRLVG